MKILVFTQHFYPENFRVNEIVKTLVKKFSHELVVVTGKPNYPSGRLFAGYEKIGIEDFFMGCKVYRVPIWLRGAGGFINLFLNYLSYIISATLYSCFKLSKYRPDIIFCYATSPLLQAIPGIIFSKIYKSKFILNVQDLWPESLSATGYVKNKLILKIVRLIVRWIYNNSDLVLVQSKEFSKKINQLSQNKNVYYWPNSVDNSFLYLDHSGDFSTPLLNMDDKFTVMFAGNIGVAQAIENIFKTACILREFEQIRFIILGDGSMKRWLVDSIESAGLKNIFVLGSFPVASMPSLLRRADVLLVTLTNNEIFSLTIPNKVQAYMAVGKPILSAVNGACSDLISESSCGLSVPADDEFSLSAAVIKMYNMPKNDLLKLGENGQKYFKKNFFHDDLVNELDLHMKRLVELT